MTLRQAVATAVKQNPDIALARLDEENARQDMYWGEMGPDPRYPAPRCAFRLDEFSCRLEAGHGGPHAVLVEWETDQGGVVQPSLSPE